MDMIFRDEDFPLCASNGFVLKQDGSSVAWCPSSEVAAEIAKRLNHQFDASKGFEITVDLADLMGRGLMTSTMADETLLGNFKEVFQAKEYRFRSRDVWKVAHGPIPAGCHIHHIDGDPLNNDLANLACF